MFRMSRRACCSSRFRSPPTASPSFLITAGRVSPCRTRVAKITQKVRKIMKFRCGKGAPFSSTVGSEMAAARASTPRIPVQATIKICLPVGRGLDLVKHMMSHPIRDDRTGIHPDDPQRHHQDRERYPVADQLAHGKVVDAAQNQSKLQAHENKNEAVEAELQCLPHRGAVDTRVDGECLRTFAPEVKAADHGCEHTRCMDPLCCEVSHVRGGKGESDFHRRVGDLE